MSLLNVTDVNNSSKVEALRLSQELSGKRSKTMRGNRPQTSKAGESGRPPVINVDGDVGLMRTTLECEPHLSSNILSGKTNKSQLEGLMKPFLIHSSGEPKRKERSQERERSKSKGKKQLTGSRENTTASQSF